MPLLKIITHVIYDMDGVLLDTEPFYTQVTEAIIAPYGKTFNWTIKSQLMGKSSLASAQLLVKLLDLPITPQTYLTQRDALIRQLLPHAQPLPGAMALTQHLKNKGIPQAVATSSKQADFALKISHHQAWFSLFDHIVKGDDPRVKQSKPAPDIFLVAAEALQASPDQCLVFEDSPAGLAAALAAGMSVVAVPDPMIDKNLFQSAHQMINGLTALVPEDWGLPPFD